MGGFFTGRSWSAVNIVAVATESGDTPGVDISIASPVPPVSEPEPQNPVQSPATDSPQEPPAGLVTEQPSEAPGVPKESSGKININIASQSELMDLPGIGTVLASRIVDYRNQHGNFSRIEDIRNVSGIGEKRYEAIQDKITV